MRWVGQAASSRHTGCGGLLWGRLPEALARAAPGLGINGAQHSMPGSGSPSVMTGEWPATIHPWFPLGMPADYPIEDDFGDEYPPIYPYRSIHRVFHPQRANSDEFLRILNRVPSGSCGRSPQESTSPTPPIIPRTPSPRETHPDRVPASARAHTCEPTTNGIPPARACMRDRGYTPTNLKTASPARARVVLHACMRA